ncbi:MAG: class I SAM-dependent methyltransferase [Bacteroidia bacterium]|nr:class I SAM-dependent methyltransferase [Bacteroidia bacterium]
MKDLFGQAILDYQNGNYTEDIITSTSISDEDILPIPYLFRSYSEMPKLEQQALDLAYGNVLDVGCGAGSHSLYLQNEKGLDVKSIDISEGAIKTCKKRGIKKAEVLDLLDETDQFDTILLLMNGTGVFQELNQVTKYLTQLKNLLNPNGQILIDSSDIIYMYEPDSCLDEIDDNPRYYGELDYYVSYKGEKEDPFKMLYLDFELLRNASEAIGLKCEMLVEGEHYDYLAKIYV